MTPAMQPLAANDPQPVWCDLAITRLMLERFRNHARLDITLDPLPVMLAGHNGAGKTNILEAVSLFAPGRGLRGVTMDALQAAGSKPSEGWTVAAEVTRHATPVLPSSWIATACLSGEGGEARQESRKVKIDGHWQRGHQGLLEVLGVVWLTPAMDGLLSGGASARRKYLDKMVAGFLPSHAAEVKRYDYLMRERNQLLHYDHPDTHWLATLEAKMAESAVAIADQRLQVMDRIRAAMATLDSAFPQPDIWLEGQVEQRLAAGAKALAVEEWLMAELEKNRAMDSRANRTAEGAHRTDLRMGFPEKTLPMEACSTGEQKAMMLSLTCALATARAVWDGRPPLILLDEVVAHLDPSRRDALLAMVAALKAQAWMTGVQPDIFVPLQRKAQLWEVTNASLTRHW